MEKEVKIKTGDEHFIYGTLASIQKENTKEKKKGEKKKLVIFCHGFTGHRNTHIFFNGARFFLEKGYDSFRFDFYNGEKNARHFEETTLRQHGGDITSVIGYFKKHYGNITLIGHSFGATAIFFADIVPITTVVFWDAVYVIPEEEKKEMEYNDHLQRYMYDWGIKTVVGKSFAELLFNFPDCGRLIAMIQKPIKFIGAGEGEYKSAKKYFAKANKPKSLVVIKSADHDFNTFADEETLFTETYEWIKTHEGDVQK